MSTKSRLDIEHLEARYVPATFGIPWHDPAQLTLSFAPDGTPIASHSSDLFESLGQTQSSAAWQRTILEAFQKWADHANLNFGIRTDLGDAFGTPGLTQFDPRFGDIRIGGNPMASEVLAIGSPPDPAISGTWAGDIFINTAYQFDGNPYSLLAVTMHEAGHALGLDNSPNSNSVMFTRYDQTRTDLSAEDIARIQALYGTRAPDADEGAKGNDIRARATAFRLPTDYRGETPLVVFGDITTTSDVDFYKFTIPTDGNDDDHSDRTVTIRMQTAGASLLAPRMRIVDASGRMLANRISQSITGDVLQVQINNLTEGDTYFIKVQSATNNEFGVGRYGLSVRFDNTSSISDQVIDQLLRGPFSKLDASAIDTFFRNSGDILVSPEEAIDTRATAVKLTGTAGYSGIRFEATGSISKSEDVDFYRFTAPATGSVLTATVWTPDQTGFEPEIALIDADGNRVMARVLANGDGTSTLQYDNATPGSTYYLQVSLGANAAQDKGNYFVTARFGSISAELTTFTTGVLSESDRNDSNRIYVGEASLMHFVLTVGPSSPGTSVRMTIMNASGTTVYNVEAQSGGSASRSSDLLVPGMYTVIVEVVNPSGLPITYTIQGSVQSNPVGPATIDSTLNPQYVTPPPPNTISAFAYPSGPVSYDPSILPGYINPANPSTYPLGWLPPSGLMNQEWFILTSNPYYWLALGY